jgi:hypothetical protein
MTKDELLKLVTVLQAELEATNRQVEILSDALAESRREVAALKINAALDKKAENARELGLDYEPVPGNFIDALRFDVAMRDALTPPAQPAPVPDATAEEWKDAAWKVWKLARTHNNTIPSHWLDRMRELVITATPHAAHDLQAELDATNRQVEILSDALAESRREHEPENEPYVSLASVQKPVVFYRCNGCGHAYEQVQPTSCDCMEAGGFDRVEYYTTPPAAAVQEGQDWSLLEATQESLREHMAEIKRLKEAQPVVPDALTSADIQEHIEYVAGWNDCRQAMMEMMK